MLNMDNEQFKPIENQLAGHIVTNSGTPCLLQSTSGKTILKLIQPMPKGHVELSFYKAIGQEQLSNYQKLGKNSTSLMSTDSGISNGNEVAKRYSKCLSENKQLLLEQYSAGIKIDDSLLKDLKSFLPKFYGVRTVNGYDYLEIENLTSCFENACTCDIKIGKVSYDPLANEDKRLKCYEKFPLQSEFGYQFLGIRREGMQLDKIFGRSLNKSSIHKAFNNFLPIEVEKRVIIKRKIVNKLKCLLLWFENQTSLQFYGSSLLVIYSPKDMTCDVKMIDFAHVFYEEMQDENYMFGLRRLISAFENC